MKMNKITKILLLAAFAVAGLTSCETYGEPEVGSTAIGPVLSGDWVGGVVTDVATGEVLDLGDAGAQTVPGVPGWMLKTYATADNAPDKAWIQIRNWYGTTNLACGLRAKVDCNVSALTFGPSTAKSTMTPQGANTIGAGNTFLDFKLLEGKVVKDGFTTASGHKTDKLILVFEYQAPFFVTNGVTTAKIEAWRDTSWPEDYE